MSYATVRRKVHGDSNGQNGASAARTAKPEAMPSTAMPSTSTAARVVRPFPLAGVQRQVKVGAPGDAAEHEAEHTADRVISGSAGSTPKVSRLGMLQRQVTEIRKRESDAKAPTVQKAEAEATKPPAAQRAEMEHKPAGEVQRSCCCVEEERASGTASIYRKSMDESDSVQRKAAEMDAAAEHAVSTKDAGMPLRPHVRQTLEGRMGVDLAGVRVHEGPAAHHSAAAINARAFTHKNDIWLGRGESQENMRLMAHEVTHVVQQGSATRRAPEAPKHKDEEDHPVVRRSLWDKVTGVAGAVWDATGGKVVDAAGNAIAMGADFFWKIVQQVAPAWIIDIIQGIRDKGIVGYLRDKLSGAFNNIFGGLSSGGGFVASVMQTFTKLLSSAQEIITALGHGDCKPLFAAVSRLGDVLSEMAGNAWDKIKEFFAPIGDFFSDLWKKFGAPVVDFLGDVAADIWNDIKALGQKIWDGTQPVRDALAAAWKWIKDELGIGEGPEGQNGLMQWVQTKLGEAWDWFKDKLQPVIGPMQALVGKIKAIVPLDAILDLRKTVHEWLQHATQMATSMRKPKGVTEDQEALRGQILPAVKAAIVSLRGRIVSAGSWVSGQIGGIAQTVTGFFSNLRSNPILGKLAGAIQWIQDKTTALSDWVRSGVMGLFTSIGNGVAKLADFVEPVLNVLKKVVSVIGNVVKELPGLVLGPVWKAIPACIRDPIKDFIIEHILSAIPIISTFLKVPDIWGKIKKLVMDFLAAVFVKGDLSGAAMMVIRFVLEAAGVNVDLMLSVLAKAASSLDEIIMHPVEFLKNLAGAIGRGLKQFVSNIATHLATGLVNWLVGPLKDLGVEPIKDLSLNSILGLTLGVLGVTEAKIRAKAEKAVGPKAVKVLEEAWKWIKALITGGLGGLWTELKGRLSDLSGMVLGGISQWITVELVEAGVAKLVEMCNPAGAVIEAIRTIYKTLTFLVNKINQILALVDSVLNSIQKIVAGDIGSAATWIETALARTVPMIIAFFANWLGIGDPAPKVREIVLTIQGKVESALDWLVDKAISIGKSIMGALGLGGKPDERTDEEKMADLDKAMDEGGQLAATPDATAATVTAGLAPIKAKYRLNMLELDPEGGDNYDIVGGFSPTKKKPVKLKPGQLPTRISYGSPDARRGGTSMTADPLSPDHGPGSRPSAAPPIWDEVNQRRNDKRLYVLGHLLNQQLGGPGDRVENLTPITFSANATHQSQVENDLKTLVNDERKMAHYELIVNYPSSRQPVPASFVPPAGSPAEGELATSFTARWWEVVPKNDDPKQLEMKGSKHEVPPITNVPPFPQT